MKKAISRCAWANKEEDIQYHDSEWGIPSRDDDHLFEMLILEGFQAGLSWHTILLKRDNFRKAFDNFDYKKIKNYKQKKIDELILNAGIVRNKLKINGTVENAKAFIDVQKEFGSFSNYIWGFADNKTVVNYWTDLKQVPAKTELSDRISKDMKKRGFKFVGSTIMYAFLQAVGIVDDHMTTCSFKPKPKK